MRCFYFYQQITMRCLKYAAVVFKCLDNTKILNRNIVNVRGRSLCAPSAKITFSLQRSVLTDLSIKFVKFHQNILSRCNCFNLLSDNVAKI